MASPSWLISGPVWRSILWFKAGWLSLVLFSTWALLPVLCLWVVGIRSLAASQQRGVLMLMVAGILLDLVLVQLDVFQFQSSSLLPAYFLVLWGWFALFYQQVMLPWLSHNALIALLALVMAPLAYWAGAALGEDLILSNQFVAWVAVGWGSLLLLHKHWWERAA